MPQDNTQQDPQAETVESLAGKIKAKYPAYKDMDNQKLVTQVTTKYPQYGAHLVAQSKLAATPTPPKASTSSTLEPTRAQSVNISLEKAQQSITRWRPRWDDPKTLLQDPTWYGRSAKYAGGEAIGAGKAGAGLITGGVKILNDAIASLDPSELYQRPLGEPGTELTKDVVGVGKGILDVGKMAYDLVRHFPESSVDPEGFGNTVMNVAMTVDGGLKGAKAFAEHGGFTSPTEALHGAQDASLQAVQGLKKASTDAVNTAHELSKHPVKGFFQKRAVEDAFNHKNGVGIAKDITSAVSKAEEEDKIHRDTLAKIDTKAPSGVIDASKEAGVIRQTFAEYVKTPDPMNPVLNSMIEDAKKTAPGQWTFEKTMEFRTKIGRAASKAVGKQSAVLWKVYGDLSNKLGDVAEKYGLGNSWDHHNELASKIHKSFPLIEKAQQIIDSNGEGVGMSQALNKDLAATRETVKSLKKYGLDEKKTLRYTARSNKILRERASSNKRITSYLYQMGPGIVPAMGAAVGTKVLASALGMGPEGYALGLGVGATVGASTAYLVHALRATGLSADILEHILDTREWPGPLKVPKEGPSIPLEPEEPSGPTTLDPPLRPVEGPTAPQASTPEPVKSEVAKQVEESLSPKAKKAQAASELIPERRSTPRATVDTSASVDPIRQARMDELRRSLRDKKLDPRDRAIFELQLQDYEKNPGERNTLGDNPSQLKKPKPTMSREEAEAASVERHKPQVTKVPEGEHGSGPIAKQAKARERVAKVRKEKGSTALGGGRQEISGGDAAVKAAQAQERLQAPHIDVSKMDLIDLQKQLQGLDKKKFKEALDTERATRATGDEARSIYEYYYLEAMEDKQSEAQE